MAQEIGINQQRGWGQIQQVKILGRVRSIHEEGEAEVAQFGVTAAQLRQGQRGLICTQSLQQPHRSIKAPASSQAPATAAIYHNN